MGLHLYDLVIPGLIVIDVVRFVLYPAFWSTLARVPSAHWSCGFCSLWIVWVQWTQQENSQVYDAHMRLGTAVRLAPNLLSINCFDEGIKTIYQGGFPKPDFYFNGFAVYGLGNLFTIKENKVHAAKKRILTGAFAKSSILKSESLRISTRDALYEYVLPLLYVSAQKDSAVEILELNFSYFLDNFVQWQFGKSLRSNLLGDEDERRMYLDGFLGVSRYTFWQYNFPKIADILRRVSFIPQSVIAGFQAVEDWNLEKCDRAQQLLAKGDLSVEDRPVIFEQALKGMSEVHAKVHAYPNRLELASDMFSLNSGAFETSGNTTTCLFYELCRNPKWQSKLQEELSRLGPSLKYVPGCIMEITELADPRALDELPILRAVLLETLRLWPSVPGGQPRIVPKACSLGGYSDIPKGTVVQAYASILHRTPEVFPDPFTWKPERWLDASPDQLTCMNRWFWGFGSGGRGCIGNHFALYSMKYLIACVYGNFTTTLGETGDMTPIDDYLSHPKGGKVEIKFHPLE